MGEQSWAARKGQHRRPLHTVRIPMRADLPDQIGRLELEARREKAVDDRENREPVAPGIARQIQDLEAELAASEEAFTFEALSRGTARELVAEHPATEDQQKEAAAEGRRLQWNPDTYPPALIAASCITPRLTVEDAVEIWDGWSDGQVAQLWSGCLSVNAGTVDVGPKSQIASDILTGSAPSSTTARR